jgi:polyhydroxybutyrate depolymerase
MLPRRIVAFGALLALLVAGLAVPAAAAAGWARTTVTYTFEGVTRSYVEARPAGADATSLPVLVELHGCCTTPYFELNRGGFEAATGQRAILVYPAGYDEVWNAGACCGSTQVDDVAFVADVVSRVLASEPAADPSRVYLVGYSNGGRMAYRMACQRPGLFAAIAVFGAVNAFACPAALPSTPVLLAAGTDDPEVTVPADGIPRVVHGYFEPTLTRQALAYVDANGCTGAGLTSTSGSVLTTTWARCSSGAPVVLRRYVGAGHAWPSDLSAVIWAFFKRFQ